MLHNLKNRGRAAALLEYSVLIIILVLAFFASRQVMKRTFMGYWRQMADTFTQGEGRQYGNYEAPPTPPPPTEPPETPEPTEPPETPEPTEPPETEPPATGDWVLIQSCYSPGGCAPSCFPPGIDYPSCTGDISNPCTSPGARCTVYTGGDGYCRLYECQSDVQNGQWVLVESGQACYQDCYNYNVNDCPSGTQAGDSCTSGTLCCSYQGGNCSMFQCY